MKKIIMSFKKQIILQSNHKEAIKEKLLIQIKRNIEIKIIIFFFYFFYKKIILIIKESLLFFFLNTFN